MRNLWGTQFFKGVPVIRKTKVDRIEDLSRMVEVKTGMDDYSGWGVREHLEWICELSGLPFVALRLLVDDGYVVLTDESVSEVWLVSRDYYKSTARLIFTE